jgi:ABC-type Fe3+-hydroxamate transport system substrate-binding protein
MFKDQLNRELILEVFPQRIISLVPSQTELLVDLGLEKNIVGITKYCVHPENLINEKVIVGGTKKVSYKKIKKLKPDLIIGNKEENTKEMVDELEDIAPTYISNIITIDDALNFITDMGVLCNKKKKADYLVDKTKKELNNFRSFMKNKPPVKVVYFIWHRPWMIAGGNNYINEMLKINNFDNVFVGANETYPEIYVEYLNEAHPELILLASEPFPFEDDHIDELRKHVNCEIKIVDGEMFSWYGSRLLKALKYFKELHNN